MRSGARNLQLTSQRVLPIIGKWEEFSFAFFFFFDGVVCITVFVFQFRAQAKKAASLKYRNRIETKKGKVRPEKSYSLDPLDDVFCTIQPEDAG